MAEPVRVNGVRVGMVLSAGAVTTGELLAVTAVVPPLVCGPPLRRTPVKFVDVPVTGVTMSRGWSVVAVQVAVNPAALGCAAPS